MGRGRHHQATATKAGDGYKLNGTKMFVLDGHTADLILVAARTDAGVSLFAVDGDAAGPHPHAAGHHGPDPQAGQARVRRHAGQAHRHRGRGLDRRSSGCSTSPPSPWPPSRSAAPRTCSRWPSSTPRTGCSSAGPIGSFQAIKHKCADMLLEVESAKSAAYYAGWCAVGAERRAARRWPRWPRPTARRRTSTPPPRTSRSTAASASPGSTRPTCTSSGPSRSELLFGDPTYHRELLAQRIGI